MFARINLVWMSFPAGLAVLCLLVAVGSAETPNQQLATLLESHDFEKATQLASGLDEGNARDTMLRKIAVAQMAAGQSDSALSSAARIDDDRTRTKALQEMRAYPSARRAGRGGAGEPQFDELIDLITSTVTPTSWDEVGGPGAIRPFQGGGVFVDAKGLLSLAEPKKSTSLLAGVREQAKQKYPSTDPRRESPLRMISLPRLEKHAQLMLAAGKPLTAEILLLAGLQRVQYVFVYPETGDLIIAGPAGDWYQDRFGNYLSTKTNTPVVRLNDLVVLMRQARSAEGGRFGCSITPLQDGLSEIQKYIARSTSKPLRKGQREKWAQGLRDALGKQNIEIDGLDPRTRVAQVLVEADYRMKLVGMGLEPGVLGVTSYLDSIQIPKGGSPPPMDILRWWFTLNYQPLHTTTDRTAFEIRGPAVKVLSENELLTQLGERVATGKSDELNQQFSQSFTAHFEALARKYPIYSDLRNVFDLALVASLIESEKLARRVGWHATCFAAPKEYRIRPLPAPRQVESVVNYRVIHEKHIVAGVSGGVSVDMQPVVKRAAQRIAPTHGLFSNYKSRKPNQDARWWWD